MEMYLIKILAEVQMPAISLTLLILNVFLVSTRQDVDKIARAFGWVFLFLVIDGLFTYLLLTLDSQIIYRYK